MSSVSTLSRVDNVHTAAMGLLGHSPSRPPPTDADMQRRDDHHEYIRYPDVHQDPVLKRDEPSYSHQHSASPFRHEPARNQYQEDTAPLVSPEARNVLFCKDHSCQ